MALLEVDNLSIEYISLDSRNLAVNDFSFSCDAGEVVGIVGESGSGKSTAMLGILGLTRAGAHIVGGNVRLDDRELLGLSDSEWGAIRGDEIGLITQNPRGSLNPVLPVGIQIARVYRAHNPEVSKDQARDRAKELLEMVGINDPERRLDSFPHELSGGMAQRVLIAMSLSCTPKLLLADEPTSGLDVTVQAQVLDDLRDAALAVGSSMVLVTQDLGIVANYCDRIYQLHAGESVEQAPTSEFFKRPAHPASAALLMAHRGAEAERFKLHGFPVDGRRLPGGCWLHQRCPFVDEAAGCTTNHPDLIQVGPDHVSRCFRHDEVQGVMERLLRGETIDADAATTAEGGGDGE